MTCAISAPAALAVSSQVRSSSALRSAGTSPGGVSISCERAACRARSACGSERSPRTAAATASAARSRSASPEPVDVGEVGRLADDHAHAGAALGAALHALDPRLVDRQAKAGALLAEDLGEVAAVLERALDDAGGQLCLDQRRAAVSVISVADPPSRAASITFAAARNSARPASVSGG